jgi:hypothetical protein
MRSTRVRTSSQARRPAISRSRISTSPTRPRRRCSIVGARQSRRHRRGSPALLERAAQPRIAAPPTTRLRIAVSTRKRASSVAA